MRVVRLWNIAGNGRIVIYRGGNNIFLLFELHYNDICEKYTHAESFGCFRRALRDEQGEHKNHFF